MDQRNLVQKLRDEWKEELHYFKLNLSWLFNRTVTTDILTVSLTKKCNLNCTYCWDFDQRERMGELTTADIKKILDSAKRLGVRSFNPFGGEPFLRKDAIEIIKYAFAIGFQHVTVTTNGTLLAEEKICELVAAVPDGVELGVLVSLDGATASENDFIRSPGSFVKTTRTIELFDKYRKQMGKRVSLIMNTVVSRNNFRSMVEQVALNKKLGGDCVHFLTPIANGGVVGDGMAERGLFILPADFEELDRQIDRIIQVASTTNSVLNNRSSFLNFKDFYRRQYSQHEQIIVAAQNAKKNEVLVRH